MKLFICILNLRFVRKTASVNMERIQFLFFIYIKNTASKKDCKLQYDIKTKILVKMFNYNEVVGLAGILLYFFTTIN